MDLFHAIKAEYLDDFKAAMDTDDKNVRDAALLPILDKIAAPVSYTHLDVYKRQYLCPSKKFDTLDELKACIDHAARRAKAYFAKA